MDETGSLNANMSSNTNGIAPSHAGPHRRRVYEAMAKVDPADLKREHSAWFAARITAVVQDAKDRNRDRAQTKIPPQ